MSYCRWSSDRRRCDIYCFEHVGGYWVIHVASRRPWLPGPPAWDIQLARSKAPYWVWWLYCQGRRAWDWVTGLTYYRIRGAHDGVSYREPTALAAAVRLVHLRRTGYNVPRYALEDLVLDAADPNDG